MRLPIHAGFAGIWCAIRKLWHKAEGLKVSNEGAMGAAPPGCNRGALGPDVNVGVCQEHTAGNLLHSALMYGTKFANIPRLSPLVSGICGCPWYPS